MECRRLILKKGKLRDVKENVVVVVEEEEEEEDEDEKEDQEQEQGGEDG
jgi:hypothetical protein